MKKLYFCIFIFLPVLAHAQSFEQEVNSIPVSRNGKLLSIPFNGGFNTLDIAMPDIDNDGDPDLLLTGRDGGNLLFYRNDGNGSAGEFILADPSLSELEFGNGDNRMAFDDIDLDGDPDLFVGSNDGQIKYYQNIGSPSSPDYELITPSFESIDIGTVSAPFFYDLNNDGLNDLIIGSYREGLFYFTRDNNTSTTFTFVDTLRNASDEIIKPGNIFYTPAFVDIDNDGDADLFAGSSDSQLAFYRNTGSASSPEFTLEDMEYIVPPDFMDFLTPAFVDIDNDSDYDLFLGSNHGFVSYYENEGTAVNPVFSLVTEELSLDFLDFGYYSCPTLVDIDADGDKDLFVSTDYGRFYYLENTGSPQSPEFTWITKYYQDIHAGVGLTHAWGDLDDDGDFDLVMYGYPTQLIYYKNIGTSQEPVLDSLGILTDTLDQPVPGEGPELADLDGDGDLDLFVFVNTTDYDRAILPVWNHGSADTAIFVPSEDTLRDDMGEAIKDFDIYFRMADIDNDSDLDLFVGAYHGNLLFYENTGTVNVPVFHFVTDTFAGMVSGTTALNLPFLADIDDDEDLDVFAGRYMGGLVFYRNISSHTVPDLIEGDMINTGLLQNYPNPFSTTTTIEYFLPEDSEGELSIIDLTGKKLLELEKGLLKAGAHRIELNSSQLSEGIYYCRLEANGLVQTKKLIVIQ